MSEILSVRASLKWSVLVLFAAVLLHVFAGLGGGAVLALWGAQPMLALSVSWLRGTRALPHSLRDLCRQWWLLAVLWAAGLIVVALSVLWPLAVLRSSGSLAAALGLSVAVSMSLLALWCTWPLWSQIERGPCTFRSSWYMWPRHDLASWPGLGTAVLVAIIGAVAVLLAWPGLIAPSMRWVLACASALLAPAAHVVLQWVQPLGLTARSVPSIAREVSVDVAAVSARPAPIASERLVADLYEAARTGRVDRALQLLETGADPHALPFPKARDQRSLMVLAAILPDVRLLRELIVRGVDVNQRHRGMTALLAATRDSWHGRPEAVLILLANGADPRIADADRNTPLHHAARSSDPGVAALLCDAAAELDAFNCDGFSPLGVSCQAGNWRLTKFLLERGAQTEPSGGTPVLLAAAGTDEDDPAGVLLLLKHNARVDARDRLRRSALHEAAEAGHIEIVKALLEAAANLESRDMSGRTPLLEAARHGQGVVLECLLSHKADRLAVDSEGRNAVFLACFAERLTPQLIQRLLEIGVPVLADKHGCRPVDVAAKAGCWSIVSLLDPDYLLPVAVSEPMSAGVASPVWLDRPPLTLLREGLQLGNFGSLPALTKLCSAEELGTLLHDPHLALNPDVVDWLLNHGAAPTVCNVFGDVPFFALLACGIEAVPSLKVFLRHGVSFAGAGGLGRWLAVCVQSDTASLALEQFACELLEYGVDPFVPSPEGDPPLVLAVRLGWLRLQQALLERGVNREARDSDGMTALHQATALGREPALKQLVMYGADPNARTADGQTALGIALSSGRHDLAAWLDWRHWSLPRRPLRQADMPDAAMRGDTEAVRRLLDLGLPIDAVDAQGCSSLLRAAGGGHLPVVRLLLMRGADLQRAANNGATPLSAAVSMRQNEIVSVLLEAGAPLEHRLPEGMTVLMLAAALGFPDIAVRLIAAGADVHASNVQGFAALHCAALYGFSARDKSRLLALLDTLLLAGANPEQRAGGKTTPLLLLLGARTERGTVCDEQVVLAGVERLLDEGVTLDVVDTRGFGPLHLAALHGLPLLVQCLLRAGADSDSRDALNR
ncbi:MAG TPA: ankyrin repeat domain-containing protein, partial [Xylella sp.]